VSVQMTAAASGTTAIRQLNNANLNLGTNDFTLVWKGSLPDWTPATAVRCMQKRVDDGTRWLFSINTDGTLNFSNIVAFSNTYQATATAANTLANNTCAEIAIVVVRETVSAAGSATFYVNGVQLGAAVSITAAATSNLDNTGTLHLNSLNTTSDGRAASNSLGWSIFNRALTSAEVLDLSINGVALADRGASQTPVYTSNFSAGVDSWTTITNVTVTGNVDSIDGQDDWLEVEKTVTSGAMRISRAITTSGTRTIKGRIFNPVGSGITHFRIANDTDAGGNLVSTTFALAEGQAIDIVRTFVADSTSALSVRVVNSNGSNGTAAVGAKFYIKNWVVGNAGLVSELIASNAQSNTGQIFDTSGNKNHALLPASGATVVGRPVSQTREVRWTNTWAGTNELQYIGGVNQAILPANAYIESIVGTVSGATPHDIIVGDGSDADRYVTITTGLAAGTTSFTLAARTTDGTNLKLTVDPDTNSDMSIAWVIKYTTLES